MHTAYVWCIGNVLSLAVCEKLVRKYIIQDTPQKTDVWYTVTFGLILLTCQTVPCTCSKHTQASRKCSMQMKELELTTDS